MDFLLPSPCAVYLLSDLVGLHLSKTALQNMQVSLQVTRTVDCHDSDRDTALSVAIQEVCFTALFSDVFI